MALLIHIFCISCLFLERIFHSKQTSNIIILNGGNSFEDIEKNLKIQGRINNIDLENNVRDYIDEGNSDVETDSPLSDIALLGYTESANELLEDAVEKMETPKECTPSKISTITLLEEKLDHLSDAIQESFMNTSEKSCSNEKEDPFNFSNDDFETEELELIEIFKNSFAMNDGLSVLFNEKYHIFPISIDETRDAAVTRDSEIIEISEESTVIKFLENALEKSLHDADFINFDSPVAASPAVASPAAASPASASPASASPASASPASASPASDLPAAASPAAASPAAASPAASTPAASTPAASTPAASTPAASTPAAAATPSAASTATVSTATVSTATASTATASLAAVLLAEPEAIQLPNVADGNAIDSKKQKERKIFGKVKKFFRRMKIIKTFEISYQMLK
ncbi:hypothetical protein TNCV_4220661 [Trichonephila clavipes]|nr:hypothetical protein TNCV_4220661 [Trichonephila clavipes]